MKFQEIHFKKPVKILQVYKNVNIYGKAAKSFEDRKPEMTWRSFSSKSGAVKNGELFLPQSFVNDHCENGCDLITIEDHQVKEKLAKKQHNITNRCFMQAIIIKLDIFEIKNDLELFLKYDLWEIGIPERDNFKLATLAINQPVEVKINGKMDFSLTAGRERVYKEQQYIFIYLGEFKKAQLLKEPFEPMIKTIPAQRKVVDLIKPLW